jgi:hypothetical protein
MFDCLLKCLYVKSYIYIYVQEKNIIHLAPAGVTELWW